MKINKTSARHLAGLACLFAGLVIATAPSFAAEDKLPEVSSDGLQLQHGTKARAVYLKPGATINQYKKVAILDCDVEFAENWEREFNDSEMATSGRVTVADMNRIKADLAAEFKKVFTEELQDKGGFEVVDSAAPDVLVLRPAIINLVVTAPDLMTPDMNTVAVASAGQMTLYLEFYDSMTSQIIARVIDPKADNQGMPEAANRVTNKAAADRILRGWADALRNHLEAVQQGDAAKP